MNKIMRVYDNLSSRQGFNDSLAHFQTVMGIISDFEEKYNLADIINTLLSEKEIIQGQVASIVAALLADKYSYYCKSGNLAVTTYDFDYLKQELKKLKAADVVVCYNHPELGYLVINPKNPESWSVTNELRKNELVTIFVGTFADRKKESVSREKIADKIFEMLNGKKSTLPDTFRKGSYKYKEYVSYSDDEDEEYEEDAAEEAEDSYDDYNEEPAAEKKEAPPLSGSQKMTPFYSVPVTNELFHNGNVEAWKRIIQSYKTKNPDLEVHIFYDGERILNIASLFKWGKVKHGSAILFAVAGDNIKDVAKLQKYLKQGASPQFEAFLKFPVNTVLNLF